MYSTVSRGHIVVSLNERQHVNYTESHQVQMTINQVEGKGQLLVSGQWSDLFLEPVFASFYEDEILHILFRSRINFPLCKYNGVSWLILL
jgi:hypothetical protein